jgi:hypothetical protein
MARARFDALKFTRFYAKQAIGDNFKSSVNGNNGSVVDDKIIGHGDSGLLARTNLL